MASENKYDIATLQALYQADLAKYQTISESNTSLDTKNGLLIGAIIAVGVFIFQDPLFEKATGDCTLFGYFLFSLLLIIGTLLLIGAFILGIFAIWPRRWRYPSNTVDEQPDYLSKKGDGALLQLISDIESIFPEIDGIMRLKAKLFTVGVMLFGFATFLLIIVKQILN